MPIVGSIPVSKPIKIPAKPAIIEPRRRWSLKVGYRSGYHPTHGHVQMFGFAIIRKYMTGVSGPTIAVGMTCALFLLLFFAPALNAMRKMTPEEFLQDFQKFQQERQSPTPTSQKPDPR